MRQARIAGIRPQAAASDPAPVFDDCDDQAEDGPIAPLLTPEEFAERGFGRARKTARHDAKNPSIRDATLFLSW